MHDCLVAFIQERYSEIEDIDSVIDYMSTKEGYAHYMELAVLYSDIDKMLYSMSKELKSKILINKDKETGRQESDLKSVLNRLKQGHDIIQKSNMKEIKEKDVKHLKKEKKDVGSED